MSTKIAFIGAGSVVFARNLIGDVLSFPELEDSAIRLMDVDPERLGQTEAIAERMVERTDAAATVEATTDRRQALEGADYVLNMIHVGGREPFENEIRIPEEYGVEQAVGDTLGPGGVFRFLRTAPTMLDIARDMEELCPDALLLNYTNPMAMLCWAVDEATEIDVIGLCHSVPHTVEAIASYTDTPKEGLEYWVAGINHVAWFLECTHGGEDLYPALREAKKDAETYDQDNVRFEILEHFGAFVTESSNHMSEYVPYFRTDEEVIREHVTDGDFEFYFTDWMETGGYLEHWIEYQEENAKRDYADEEIEIDRSEEYGSRVVHSMETDEPRRMNLNVRNEGLAITNLGSDACVEVPCLVDGHGVHPCAVGDLPPQLAAIDRSNVAVQRLAVRGLLERDLGAIRQAIKLDPLTAATLTLPEIDRMIDDLLAANAEYLPGELTADGR
jgi:alpha-galactosidase